MCDRRALYLQLLNLAYIASGNVLQQLWPLDSQTCESEVLLNTYQHNQVCINYSFDTQPSPFPFKSIVFDGTSHIDSRVEFTTTSTKHYSVQGFFYFTQGNGVLFDYKADQNHREFRVWLSNRKFRLYKKVRSSLSKTYNGGVEIVLNTWYYIAASVGSVGYVYLYVNGTKDIYGELGNRNSAEIPGNIRIGQSLDGLGTALNAKCACIGLLWNEKWPLSTELQPLCETTPWMPTKSTNNLYFAYKNDTSLFPKPISSVQRCSVLQCAYACLQDPQCYYIYFDGHDELNQDCKTCYMYSRVETTGLEPQTQKLYKVKY